MDILNLNLDESNETLTIRLQYMLDQLRSNYQNALVAVRQIVRLKGINSAELMLHLNGVVPNAKPPRDDVPAAETAQAPEQESGAASDFDETDPYDTADVRLFERVRLAHVAQETTTPLPSALKFMEGSTSSPKPSGEAKSETSTPKPSSETKPISAPTPKSPNETKSETPRPSSVAKPVSAPAPKPSSEPTTVELLEDALRDAKPVAVQPRSYPTETAKLNRLHAMPERERQNLYRKIFERAKHTIESSMKTNETIRAMSQEKRDALIAETASAYLDEFCRG